MKKLYRSRTDSVLAGVCGGIAEYLHVDVTLIRLAFVALGFLFGSGLLFYILAAIVLPKEPLNPEDTIYTAQDQGYDSEEKNNTSFALGALLVFIGVVILAQRYIIPLLPQFARGLIWPLILIGLGAYLLWGRKDS